MSEHHHCLEPVKVDGVLLNTQRYWPARELVLLGVFAACAKLSTLIIALAGGGMNPVTLFLKNAVFTILLVVLLTKIPKPGTLTLFTIISLLVGTLLLGASLSLLPSTLTGALVAEGLLYLLYRQNAYRSMWKILLAVGLYEVISKTIAFGVVYLFLRESPELLTVILPIISLGFVGAFFGLFWGNKTIKELHHAGFIRD